MKRRHYLQLAIALFACRCVAGQSISFKTADLAYAVKNAPYRAEIRTTTNGRCPESSLAFSIVGGQLPKGLELYTFGVEGTPLQIGHFHFTVRAANRCTDATKAFDLVVTGRPFLMVSPREIKLQYRSGTSAVAEDILRVQGTWPDQPYSFLVSNGPWLSVEPSEGKVPDTESALTGDRVHIRAIASGLAPGVYHATIRFYTPEGENAPHVDVTLQIVKAE